MAFIAAAGIAAGAGIGGALISSGASKDAAAMQAEAAQHAADLQYQEYQQTREDQSPYRQAGVGALSQMQDPYFQQTFSGMGSLQDDPGYQFRMDQGQKALEASAAARGGLMGGNFGTALTQYGQDYASNEYQNAYNRFTNNQQQRFGRLSTLAGMGQTANGQLAQAGMNYANQAGEDMMGAANANAAGRIGSANAWSGALSGIGGNVMQGAMMNNFSGNSLSGNNNYTGSGAFSNAALGTLNSAPQYSMPVASSGGYSLSGGT